ncbi:hypothetical protein DDN98_18905 [Vibrio cholerae]|uniref:hypothetical protein n=1 Tax=Vibrio cholerae TaxID=666 RepID=UPI000E0B3565|nr:hypothetical protein [Vibrio cholerae]EGR0582283.1 hypothetical protein [Vibrio cholerae]EGR4295834.1 hypothetical protein [Vibrio cholerae]EGR4299736.1 hypothetical protein [Vibrio cholerae]ELT7571717.1 hypothetical protein [Vibrio cholerae]MCX9532648.1 hypothetical protein [Vibrio cholerae]
MNYQIAKDLPPNIMQAMGLTEILKVPIEPCGGEKLSCYNNVRRYLKMHEGTIQFGWTFSQLGNIVFKANAHVVVKNECGEFLCVTPPEHQVSSICFAPDDGVSQLINSERLPAKIFSLVEDEVVNKYVKLENLFSQMRLEGNLIGIDYINHEKYLLSSKLKAVYEKYGEP